MNKFATVYKYAMDKQAEHNKAYVDSIRRKTPLFGDGYRPESENIGERYLYANSGTPGANARLNEVMDPNYPANYAKARAFINNSISPMDSLRREEYPAVKPSHRPAVRRALNEKTYALRNQPAPTTISQLGNAFRDVYGKPIATAYNKAGDVLLSAKDQIGKYMSRINPLRTTK